MEQEIDGMSNIGMKVSGIESALSKVELQPSGGAAQGADKPNFASAFKAALDGVNAAQMEAESLAQAFSLNESDVSLEETMIAASKANISFQSLVQVRNRVISAYQDIMNMPV